MSRRLECAFQPLSAFFICTCCTALDFPPSFLDETEDPMEVLSGEKNSPAPPPPPLVCAAPLLFGVAGGLPPPPPWLVFLSTFSACCWRIEASRREKCSYMTETKTDNQSSFIVTHYSD